MVRHSRRFHDRHDAGRALGKELLASGNAADAIVIGLPRGGVVVAAEVAEVLGAPLDVLAVRKLGVPGHEELAMGAIASGGSRHLNDDIVRRVRPSDVERVLAREEAELARRDAMYRKGAPRLVLAGRTVIVTDDGLATGATMAVAVAAVHAADARRVVAAAPVGAPDTTAWIRTLVDDVAVLIEPDDFTAVGWYYEDFRATTDEEVIEALAANRGNRSAHD
jgi:predicted phosphoribosyltransferase